MGALLAAVRAALPDALALPIGTSAAVGGLTSGELRVEAMEGFGVLRACAQAGVPAVEVRAICERYGQHYNTGSLPRQFGQVVWRILRHAFPSRVRRGSRSFEPLAS